MGANISEPLTPAVHDDVRTRALRGRVRRKEVPRSALGAWEPGASRPDPVALLREQELTRVPELVPLRHERMLVSPFAFYRGAAVIMAADLAAGPHSGLWVQCCGDAHLSNFGGFASPERSMLFDINDFDETSRGPFEWDVKRLAASFEVAGRAHEFATQDLQSVVTRVGAAYRTAMSGFADMTNLATRYARLDVDRVLADAFKVIPERAKQAARNMRKAQSKDNLKAFHKLTRVVDGEVRFASDPPLLAPIAEVYSGAEHDESLEWLREGIRAYRHSLPDDRRHLLERYRLIDFARKVVGVGSVGTRCWLALFLGRDDGDPLFLQVKEAERSVLEAHAGKSSYSNHGQRVVEGQRLLQAASDILLGWLGTTGMDGVTRDYYVRQLWDWKLSPDIDSMEPKALEFYADMCAWTLARAHAVSGDAIAIAAYLGSSDRFDTSIADFARSYADQNDRDFDTATAQQKAGLF
jgi:uncharacterized protein (DUF2252 family)